MLRQRCAAEPGRRAFGSTAAAAAAQLGEPSGPPALADIRSWSLIGTEDHAVPPSLQEQMSTNAGAHISYVKAGHLGLITRPNAVVRVIDQAIRATSG